MAQLLASSRRKPWPYDLIIDPGSTGANIGVMLKPNEEGILVSKRAQPLEAAPTSFEYGSQSPFLERTYEYKNLFMGMGARVQEEGEARRYYYAINADLSINGRWMKGPKFTELQLVAPYRDGNGGTIAAPTTVTTTLNGAIDADDTAVTLTATATMMLRSALNHSSAAAGQYPFYIKIDNEYLKVTAEASANVFTCVRGQLGSTAASHLNGATVTLQAGGKDSVIGGGVTQIELAKSSSTEYKFVAAGRCLFMLDGDAVSHVYDFGYQSTTAIQINQMVRFYGAGQYCVDSLYLALSNGRLAELPSVAQASATPARVQDDVTIYAIGSNQGPTIAPAAGGSFVGPATVTTAGDEMWFGYGNKVQKVEADPSVDADWAGAITIGDASSLVTWLAVNHNEVFVMKEDGIYTFSTTGFDQELYPGLRITPNSGNGKQAIAWQDHLYVPFRDGFYKISAEGELKPIGTEQLLDNGSEVQGRIQSFTGHGTWFGYVVLYNERNGSSYLMKYGSWVEHDQGSLDTRIREVLRFRDVYHGAIKKWGGTLAAPRQATHISVQPMGAATNDRLYAGFSDGRLEYAVLPRGGPNPANDSNCRFTTDDAEVYWPVHHAGFQADQKAYHGFSVFGPVLDGRKWVEVGYNTDPSMDAYTVSNSNVALKGFYEHLPEDLFTPVTGTATSGAATTLTNSGAAYTVDAYTGKLLRITGGTGAGQERWIASNTATVITVSSAWTTNPDSTSVYAIVQPPTRFTVSGQRQDWPEGFSPKPTGKAIIVKAVLKSASSFDTAGYPTMDDTTTPVVEGMALHEAVRPSFIMEYIFTAKARNFAAKRDGTVDRRRAAAIRTQLIACIESVPTVNVYVPFEDEQEISFVDYSETLLENQKRYGLEWDITMRGIQYRTLSTGGQSGGSQSSFTGHTYADLESYTYEQLETVI